MEYFGYMSGAIDEGKTKKIHSGLKYFDPFLMGDSKVSR
jgi:hypothetical protein